MQLQFKNKHIFFTLCDVWTSFELDYRFKTHINEIVTLNSDDDYLQTMSIDSNTLVFLVSSNTSKPEGISMSINKEMLESLTPQLFGLASIGDVEAIDALTRIQYILEYNDIEKSKMITNGKNKILS